MLAILAKLSLFHTKFYFHGIVIAKKQPIHYNVENHTAYFSSRIQPLYDIGWVDNPYMVGVL
jgi:hypothetical protein